MKDSSLSLVIRSDVPLPKMRGNERRVTPQMMRMEIRESVLVDEMTAKALTAWFSNNGKKGARRIVGTQYDRPARYRVWRVS